MSDTYTDPSEVSVTFVNSAESLLVLEEALSRASRVAIDTETHAGIVIGGLWMALRVVAIATRYPDGSLESFVVDVRDVPPYSLAPLFERVTSADAWNANFDDRVLEFAGCPVASWRDAMHLDSVLHSGVTGFEFWHSLAFAAKKYLGVELSGKGTVQLSYDADSDLSPEQISYPGQDATVTLMVAEHLDQLLAEQGLLVPASLEAAARPFILEMTKRGIPFQMDAWKSEVLFEHSNGRAEALRELASLTGGSEVTLFGESDEPSWNPDSDVKVREALNEWATEAVHNFTGGRLLLPTDKLDKTTLKQIKHPLAKALLKYREHAKLLSTYGANLDQYVGPDGRIRPQYKQGGVVATGRLASDKPNAQNFSPLMKSYFRPSPEVDDSGVVQPRAIVYADLSQAELRVLAQVSGEERMRELFRLGGDFHARTASDMFGVDMDSLRVSDPVAYGNFRKKAKGVNFGIPYGLGAAALATNLTVNSGLETTVTEATEALDRYAKAYPAVDAWLSARDRYVRSLADQHKDIDWDLSLELYELWSLAKPKSKSMRRSLGRPASSEEVSVEIMPDSSLREHLGGSPSEDEVVKARQDHIAKVAWALSFDAPVVLSASGAPWTFESRSLTGRRRLFTIPMDSSPTIKGKFEGVITSAMLTVCTSDKAPVAELRERFAQMHGLSLPVGTDRCPQRPGESRGDYRSRLSAHRKSERVSCVKAFEGDRKRLKYELLKFIREHMGEEVVLRHLLPMAMGDQIRSMGNRFRNHPIQSLVADVGLQYYAELWNRLPKYRNAFPIQAVHDSIAIECDLAEAPALCDEVRSVLEGALAHWCPDVPAVADADIRLSLSDDDVVDPSTVPSLVAQLRAEASAA